MKKHFKIMLVAICVVMMSALVAVAIVANATIETDATLGSIQVATAGSINLRFNYTDLGSAEKMVVEVNQPDGTLYDTWDVPVTEIEGNVVKVPLTPSQMTYTVSVYAVDTNGNKGAAKTTSVLEYAQDVLANEGYGEYHNSMKALLNWGAMSEAFFGAEGVTSSANADLYGRNTNPVQDAVAFFNGEGGAVTPSENITGVGYEVFLEPGKTVMRFMIKYTGAGTLTATVKKGDNAAVATALEDLGNNEYYVNINNVGVAVYNTPYTVTVTDGTETFTATKTVLEYLNTLAFTGEDAAQHNIARSMYQFYTHAMGTVNAETCAHTGLHMATTTDGKSEYIACSSCLAQMGDRVVDKDVIWFANPQEFTGYTYNILDTETGDYVGTKHTAEVLYDNDGTPYVRFAVAAGDDRLTFNILTTPGQGGKTPVLADTGRYVVIKYRATGDTQFHWYVNGKYADEQKTNLMNQGEWMTAVLDFDGCSYYPAENSSLQIQNTLLKQTVDSTLDIAYIAVCDTMESARGLLTYGETYRTCPMLNPAGGATLRGIMNYPELNSAGKCVSDHVLSLGSEDIGTATRYTYTCYGCGITLAPSRDVPKTVDLYWNPAQVKMWDKNNQPSAGNVFHNPIAKDGEAYVNCKPLPGGAQTASTVVPEVTTTLGKYLAIKYRFTAMEATDTNLYINTIIAGQDNLHTITNSVTDGWVVAVVDISGFNGFAGNEESVTFKLHITHSMELDVAYVVMSDDMADIRALLGENETYFDRGNRFKNVGIEYNKDGTPVTETETTEEVETTEPAETTEPEETNVFDLIDFTVSVPEGREPVILQLTDTQIIDASQERTSNRLGPNYDECWAADKKEEKCYDYLREIIEATNPDLILITGDLIYGEFDDSGEVLLEFIEFFESYKIPWAPVFGNHDNESHKGVDWQCRQLENAEHCLFVQRELTGNGNYTVGIEQGGKLKRVFFMLDSNGCSTASEESLANGHTKTGLGFGSDQINWYTDLATEITKNSPDTKFSMAFHIQLSIFGEAFAKYNTDGNSSHVHIDQLDEKFEGDFGYIGADLKGLWDDSNAVWNGFKALGVDSVFVGHEHANSASIMYEGVRLQYGMKSSAYDRLNYIDEFGNIETTDYSTNTPWVGGTVLKLSEVDGSMSDAYIYYCEEAGGNIDWDSFKPVVEASVNGLQKDTDFTMENGITVTGVKFDETVNAYKVEAANQGKVKINVELLKNKSSFTFTIYVPSISTSKLGGLGEFAIRVKPNEIEPEGDGGSNIGYIDYNSIPKAEDYKIVFDTWQTFTVDISDFGEKCTEFAFVIAAGNTIYLRDIVIE